jgi:hypothetical protein
MSHFLLDPFFLNIPANQEGKYKYIAPDLLLLHPTQQMP